MLYLITDSYSPGTAGMNRLLGYLKGFSTMGIETTIVFIYPDSRESRMTDTFSNVSVRYLWKEYYYSKRKLVEVFLRKIYPIRFRKCLKSGDIVFTYGVPEFQHYTLGVKGVNYYHERTEHPLAVSLGNPLTRFPMSKYYKDCRGLDGIFVISKCLRDFFVTKGVNKEKVHIINMIVDPTRFNGLKKQNTERYIAYCGVIFNNKDGIDLLIKSFAMVSNTHPDVKLYVIGPVPQKTDNNVIIELIRNLGIEDKVVLTGRIPAEKMPQLLKDAEICALNRPDGLRAQAGFPTKLGEYLLTENPVVVTSVGDIPLFLEDGVSALIAAPNSPSSFAEKLDWALTHIDEAKEIGKKGCDIAKLSFNAFTETAKIKQIILG